MMAARADRAHVPKFAIVAGPPVKQIAYITHQCWALRFCMKSLWHWRDGGGVGVVGTAGRSNVMFLGMANEYWSIADGFQWRRPSRVMPHRSFAKQDPALL